MENKIAQPLEYLRQNSHIEFGKSGVFYDGEKLESWVDIKIMKIRKDRLILMGSHICDDSGMYDCYLRDNNGKLYPLHYTADLDTEYQEYEDIKIMLRFFEMNIDIRKIKRLAFVAMPSEKNKSSDNEFIPVRMSFAKFGKLFLRFENSYYARDGYIIDRSTGLIKINRGGNKSVIKRELKFGLEIIRREGRVITALIRILALVKKMLKKKEIWIVTDRDNAAGDNGEAFFKFLAENEKNSDVFFAVSGKCRDYKRMKQYGKVLKLGSLRYKLNFLASDKLISSQIGEWVSNAFGEDFKYFKSLYDFDLIFLQHGIILTDLSSWFQRYNKDVSMFVTSATKEYESVCNYGFNCDSRIVRLTGLPRYDYLENKAEKKIVFLPTWRREISGDRIKGTSHREYSNTFKETYYYKFYNGLINNKKLIDCLKEKGFTGELYIHPAFTVQAVDFNGNDTIKVVNEIADYRRVLKENALLITDYSSVMFDFSYLKKPIVYAQFDADEFFTEHHCKKGYFEYERDGFGPVTNDMDSTVNQIIHYIDNGCIMEEEYKKRVDAFFAFTDRNNCKRVYEEIKKISGM